jgi:hypothetical protein
VQVVGGFVPDTCQDRVRTIRRIRRKQIRTEYGTEVEGTLLQRPVLASSSSRTSVPTHLTNRNKN